MFRHSGTLYFYFTLYNNDASRVLNQNNSIYFWSISVSYIQYGAFARHWQALRTILAILKRQDPSPRGRNISNTYTWMYNVLTEIDKSFQPPLKGFSLMALSKMFFANCYWNRSYFLLIEIGRSAAPKGANFRTIEETRDNFQTTPSSAVLVVRVNLHHYNYVILFRIQVEIFVQFTRVPRTSLNGYKIPLSEECFRLEKLPRSGVQLYRVTGVSRHYRSSIQDPPEIPRLAEQWYRGV